MKKLLSLSTLFTCLLLLGTALSAGEASVQTGEKKTQGSLTLGALAYIGTRVAMHPVHEIGHLVPAYAAGYQIQDVKLLPYKQDGRWRNPHVTPKIPSNLCTPTLANRIKFCTMLAGGPVAGIATSIALTKIHDDNYTNQLLFVRMAAYRHIAHELAYNILPTGDNLLPFKNDGRLFIDTMSVKDRFANPSRLMKCITHSNTRLALTYGIAAALATPDILAHPSVRSLRL